MNFPRRGVFRSQDMSEAGSNSPHLEEEEQRQAAKHAPLGPMVIHEIIRDEGKAELERPASSLFWSGLAAGLSMGFSFLTQALLQAGMPDAPWRHLVASLGYSVGFAIVILGRQQLFTESTLTAVLPVLSERDARTFGRMLRLWGIVLFANLLGTWLFAAALAYGGVAPPEAGASLRELAAETVAHPFWNTLLRAVFAGWLIALMVWLLPSARSARILVIVMLTYVVALARLSHVIAGSSEAAFAVLAGPASLADYTTAFLLPTLIGNTIGGVLLVALLNYAPLAPEMKRSTESKEVKNEVR